MATTYVPKLGGYIADVPYLRFRRCDGKIFKFDELTSASATPQINTIDISAGWSLYPVAVLPGQSTLDLQFSSGKFEPELFSMTNATDFEEETAYHVMDTRIAVPDAAAHTIVIDGKVVQEGDLFVMSIGNLEQIATGETLAKGKFQVAFATDKTTVTFHEDDCDGTEFAIEYMKEITANVAEIDNKASAVGEAFLAWPVYSDGQDCTKSGIMGYVYMDVYRARVTAQPGFSTQYKSAA